MSISRPLVSIVINNYNYGRYLPAAIESALSQAYAPTEVIVVDDGSTDNSRQVIASYDGRIVPVFKKNGGQASAINTGFAESKGLCVLFLDSDDRLLPHALERVMSVWQPSVAKVQFRLRVIRADGSETNLVKPPWHVALPNGNVLQKVLAGSRYTSPPTTGNVFSREALNKMLPIPEAEFGHFADNYLIALAVFHGDIVSLNECLGAYRIHESNVCGTLDFDIKKVQAFLRSDFSKFKYFALAAEKVGCSVPSDRVFRDRPHLFSRLASLRLSPRTHPISSDSLHNVALAGWRALGEDPTLGPLKVALLRIAVLLACALPRGLAIKVFRWMLTPASRPRWQVRALEMALSSNSS